jgi:signal transduction histidine kinase
VVSLADRPAPPAPIIDSVEIDGVPRPARAGKIAATVDRAQVLFRFTAFAPAGRVFAFQLEGHDADWSPALGEAVARYRDLPPGRYVFRVRAAAGRGGASGRETSLRLELAPVLYRRPLAQALAALALVGLAVLLHRLKLRLQHRRFRAIADERARLARELHDSLGQGFTAAAFHVEALRQELASPAADGASARAPSPQVVKLLHGLDHVLERAHHDARQLVWDLRAAPARPGLERQIASLLAELEPVRGTNAPRLAFTRKGPLDAVPAFVEHELVQLCREAVTNAVRHAGARDVRVSLEASGPRLCLVVDDDGKGFDAEGDSPAGAHGFDASHSGSDHFGLLGMRERARRLGAQIAIDSTPGGGTTVTVLVDLKRNLDGTHSRG